jgi:hypothetical protein
MTDSMWFWLDDASPHHPKFVRVGPEAYALFVAGLWYCHRYKTGGLIPMDAVPHLLPGITARQAMELAGRLARNDPERPSWVAEGGHYRVQDDLAEREQHGEEPADRSRTRNALRQQRYRDRLRERKGTSVTRDVTGDVTGDVTRYVTGVTRDLTQDVTGDVTRDVMRDVTDDVTRYVTPPLPEPLPPLPPFPKKEEFFSAPAREGRDLEAEFGTWSSHYPRRQGHHPARQAFLAIGLAGELPAVGELLATLAAQVAAQPDPRFWRLPARYLRERGWTDLALPAAAERGEARRGAPRRGQQSDARRRARLREIAEEALAGPAEPAGICEVEAAAETAAEEPDGRL